MNGRIGVAGLLRHDGGADQRTASHDGFDQSGDHTQTMAAK